MKKMLLTLSNTKSKWILGGAVVALSLLVSPLLQAQVSDNWNDGNATTPVAWLQTGSSGGSKAWSFPVNPADSTLAYNLYRNNVGTIMSLLGYGTGAAGPVPDFIQSVDVIDWDNNTLYGTIFGLVGRLSATSTGYGLLIRNPTGGSATAFRINRFDPGGIQTTIAEGIFVTPLIPSSGDYKLVFSAFGSTLTGQIFDKATGLVVPLSGGTGVGGGGSFISATDSTYAAGMYGVGALYINANPVTATFDNYQMIPEPSALALGALGLVGLFWARRGRLGRHGRHA